MNGQHNEMNGGGNVQPNEINGDIQPNEINGDINPIAINDNGLLNVDIQPNVMNGEIHPININGNVLPNVDIQPNEMNGDIHPNEMGNDVLVILNMPLNLNQDVPFHDMDGYGEIHEINNGDVQPPHEENNDDTEEPDSALSFSQNEEVDPEMKTVGNNNDSSSTTTSSSTMTPLSDTLFFDKANDDSDALPNDQEDLEENPKFSGNYGAPKIEDIGSDYDEDCIISPLHSPRQAIDLEALNTSLALVIEHVDLINLLNEEDANEKASQHVERTDQANKKENVDLNGNIQLNKKKTDAEDAKNQEDEVENNGNDQENKDKNDDAGGNKQAKEENDNVAGDGNQGGF